MMSIEELRKLDEVEKVREARKICEEVQRVAVLEGITEEEAYELLCMAEGYGDYLIAQRKSGEI